MKLLAFAASGSSKSINQQLVTYAASLVEAAEVEVLKISDYEMPLYSQDKENEIGQPEHAKQFFSKLGEADAIIISFAEHNGHYTVAYKNLFDWTSRIDMKVFQNKPLVMLSTSPGPGGAASVLAAAHTSAPYFAADVKATLSIPNFFDNFDTEKQTLNNPVLITKLKSALEKLIEVKNLDKEVC